MITIDPILYIILFITVLSSVIALLLYVFLFRIPERVGQKQKWDDDKRYSSNTSR